jgi:hypothetical protein
MVSVRMVGEGFSIISNVSWWQQKALRETNTASLESVHEFKQMTPSGFDGGELYLPCLTCFHDTHTLLIVLTLVCLLAASSA